MKKLTVKKGTQCMACLECVRACSEAFYKEFDPSKACLQIIDRNGAAKPMVCVQCGKCAEACEQMCIRDSHGPAPIPEEGKWVQAKEIKDISGFTHGVGWCAPQQGACKLSLNIKDGVIEEALVETIGCSGMTHSAAMASEDVYKRQSRRPPRA